MNYNVNCYNHLNDFPVAMASVDEFSIDNLLRDVNLNIRRFSLIVIKKEINEGNYTTIVPLAVIYDKNIWKVSYSLRKFWIKNSYIGFKTICSCYHHSLDYHGRLKKISCSNQEEIIREYNKLAEKLKYKDNTLVRKLW